MGSKNGHAVIARKILLPGVSVLERLVSSVREHASSRLWQLLARLPTPPQRAHAHRLLAGRAGGATSPLAHNP